MTVTKERALEEIATLKDMMELQPIRNGIGPRNADRTLSRLSLLENYVKDSRQRFSLRRPKPKARLTSIDRQARVLAGETLDAYSANRYRSWTACARFLLEEGWSEKQAEAILRSKVMRWAADRSASETADVRHLRLYVCDPANGVTTELVNEWASQ
jgi:hypothetical protein